MKLSVTLTLPPPPLTVVGGGTPESLLEKVISLTSRKRRVITNASAILNDESKISPNKPNHFPRACGIALEEHLIVRFASQALANAVRASLHSGTLDSDLQIFFDKSSFPTGYSFGPATSPNAMVIFKGQQYKGWLVDLPCLIETHISQNKKQYYKVADISQMLLVTDEKSGVPCKDWPHGMSPPLSFVRERRFRRLASRDSINEVSSAVRRLLEADRKALSVELELIDTPSVAQADGDEENEDITSVASGPISSMIDVSDDEMSELAAEINYDRESFSDNQEDEELEYGEGLREGGDEISSPSELLHSNGHFSLLQSRIYSRLATVPANPEINRFSDALKILSQQTRSASGDSSIIPPSLEEDYEVYDEEEDHDEQEDHNIPGDPISTGNYDISQEHAGYLLEYPDKEKDEINSGDDEALQAPILFNSPKYPDDILGAYAQWLYDASATDPTN